MLTLATMDPDHSRDGHRVACTSAARLTFGDHTILTLATEVSAHGLRVRTPDRTLEVGALVSIWLLGPSHALSVAGHVRWVDRARHEVGLELVTEDRAKARELGMMLLAFAFETQCEHPAAALVVDDEVMAARLCEPLRQAGYVPRLVRAVDGDVTLHGEHPPIKLVLADAGASPDVLATLAREHPAAERVAIGGPDLPFEGLDEALAVLLARLTVPAKVPVARRGHGRRKPRSLSGTNRPADRTPSDPDHGR